MGVAPIKMPQLGESVTEGTVDRWLKKEGDHVRKDEPLVEVVTDKVNAEIPSPFEGKLLKISVAEGTTIAIGTEIAQIEVEGAGAPTEPEPTASPEAQQAVPQQPVPPQPEAGQAATGGAAPARSATGMRFSPAVRRLAEEHGIDPSVIQGSGEGGRVTRDDVLAYVEQQKTGGPPAAKPAAPKPEPAPSAAPAAAAPAAAPAPAPPAPTPTPAVAGDREELVRINAVRRSIADRMVHAVQTQPHVWTLLEVDMTNLVRYRNAQKEDFRQRHGFGLSFLPFIAQVVADALRQHPYLNSTWTDDGILLRHYVNLGFAVAVPPDGLIVPVVRDADRLGFSDLARAINDLVERARERKLKPEDVQAGTFTINNTGATGSVESFSIINQNQAAILNTEAIVKRPVALQDDAIAVRSMMNLTMTFDHRILDGYIAGQFTAYIKRRLEEWSASDLKL